MTSREELLSAQTVPKLIHINRALRTTPPEERAKIFAIIEQTYCRHCGREHASTGRTYCQCENDE